MSSGPLHDLITVEAEIDTPDGMGGFDHSWASIGQLWGAVAAVRSGEQQREGALRSVTTYKIRVLAEAARSLSLDGRHRLRWNGITLNIREAPLLTSRAVHLDVIAESGVTQ